MNKSTEKNQIENLKAIARTKKLIDEGKDEIEITLAESTQALVNQIAFYRGVDLTAAKKIINQHLKEVTK